PGEDPATVAGDAHGDDLELVRVEGGDHAARAHSRDGVLGAAAPENDGDPGAAAPRVERTRWGVHAAHPTGPASCRGAHAHRVPLRIPGLRVGPGSGFGDPGGRVEGAGD